MKPPLKMFVRVLEEQMEEYRAAAGFIRKVTHAIRVLGAAFRCLPLPSVKWVYMF